MAALPLSRNAPSVGESALMWLGYLIILGLVVVLFWSGSGWIGALRYSMEYRVGISQVHMNPRPTDCDWGHSPFGDKGCSYKATVTAYNSAGDVVGGDEAPTYGHDTSTGKPIVSYDSGKTWVWLSAPDTPDPKIKSVQVQWVKVTD